MLQDMKHSQNFLELISSETVTLHKYLAQDDKNMFKPFLK